jgi:hypothetical protein
LIEPLMVNAIIAMRGAMLQPGLSNAKQEAAGISSINNKHLS